MSWKPAVSPARPTSSSPRPTRPTESSDNLPYRETHPLQGRYPYDVSKSCTDLVAQMYAATYGVKTAIARCGNLFGGGDLNFSRTIPGLIKATLAGEPFVIRSDGKFVRDFLYVKDAAECYLILGEKLAEDPSISAKPSTSASASGSPSSTSST